VAASTPAPPLPIDYAGGPSLNTVGSSARITVRLEAEETRALLREVPKAYQTHIDEVLLTALAQALAPWTLSPSVVVNLEGHGREPLFAELDLSRTVGWFTAMAPLRLTLKPQQDPGAALRAVKEQIRTVPDGIFGYGILRYLSQDASLRNALASAQPPDISFNYLGQYDGMLGGDGLLTVAAESAGATSSPRQRRPHLIDVVAMTHRGQLQLDWIYCANLHSRATIEALAHRCVSALRELITHCTAPGVGGYTPSDFPMAELEENQLNEVLSQVEFE
jgi:microcystin synthetase protein McyA